MKFLIFQLNDEYYALDQQYVSEIITIPKITSVPLAKDYCVGVSFVRDKLVEIIDLKVKFKIKSNNKSPQNPVLIITTFNNNKLAFIADSVLSFVEGEPQDNILKYEDNVCFILDSQKIIN